MLFWTAGAMADSHELYLGTDPGNLELKGSLVYPFYDPAGLEPNTQYHWRVDEVNGGGTTTGDVWTFTTAGPPGRLPQVR